mgnify:FL=1|tara:strand:+ start:130 stop:288 length:159 start_codon:yes stop_codon:yes gene_type:complete
MEITKEELNEYDEVRDSGMTNMFNVSVVSDLSGLSKEKIFYIMKNYERLKNE